MKLDGCKAVRYVKPNADDGQRACACRYESCVCWMQRGSCSRGRRGDGDSFCVSRRAELLRRQTIYRDHRRHPPYSSSSFSSASYSYSFSVGQMCTRDETERDRTRRKEGGEGGREARDGKGTDAGLRSSCSILLFKMPEKGLRVASRSDTGRGRNRHTGRNTRATYEGTE